VLTGATAQGQSKKSDGDKTEANGVLANIAEGIAGLVFGVGVTVSGMRRVGKVSGFLSLAQPSFDPSLMLVMGGAMAVAIPGYWAASKMATPACTQEFPGNPQLGNPHEQGTGMWIGSWR